MAENDPDDGWKVVTSQRQKPSMAKSCQAVTPNESSEPSLKASATSASNLESPTSIASTSEGRTASPKAKSERHDNSSHHKSKGEKSDASELLPSPEPTRSTEGVPTASSGKKLQPAIEMLDPPQQTLAAASAGHISPTRSHSSSESASYVTAQQSQTPETTSSSSASYDSADEGGTSLDPSLYVPNSSSWVPPPQHESSSLTPKASLWVKPASNPEVSPTASKPSLGQPSKSKNSLTTLRTSLWIGAQHSDPHRHGIGEAQVYTDEKEQQEATLVKENKFGLRTTTPGTNNASASNKESISSQTSSEQHELAKLAEVSPQSSSENIIPRSSAGLTVLPPTLTPESDSPIFTDTADISDIPHQRVAVYLPRHVPEATSNPTHQEEAIIERGVNSEVKGTSDVVISDDTESLGNTAGINTAQTNPRLSSKPSTTTVHEDDTPSSSIHQGSSLVSATSTSVDPHIALNPSTFIPHEDSTPPISTHHDLRHISASSTSRSLQTSSTPSHSTIREDSGPSFTDHKLGVVETTPASTYQLTSTPSITITHEGSAFSSSIHHELGLLPSSSTPIPHEFQSVEAEHPSSIISAASSEMPSGFEKTESGSTSIQSEKGDEESTPKPKFAQLVGVPEQASTSPTRPPPLILSPISEESSEFANFRRATIPAESPSPSRAESLTRDQAAAVRPRLNANEQALTGLDVVAATSSSGPSRARAPTSRASQVAQPPPPRAFGQPRRSHAIPIRAPLPSPGFARQPPVIQEYDHGLRGVPSHYIPLYGSLHGMFFDPGTNMFVGDGPPRATPERMEPPGMSTTTRAQVAAEPSSNRPVNPDDALHVQSREQIASINAAGARAAATPPLRRPVGVAPTSAPTRAFQWYFCRCTGRWLTSPHNCPEPPPTPLPSAAPIMPGTVLGPEWMTHRLVVDASIYPGGVIPVPGSAAVTGTLAVGGGTGNMPAHWFAPVPAGTVVGGEPTAVGETPAVTGGAGGGPAEGEAKKKKKKKSGKRRKNKGAAAEEEEGG